MPKWPSTCQVSSPIVFTMCDHAKIFLHPSLVIYFLFVNATHKTMHLLGKVHNQVDVFSWHIICQTELVSSSLNKNWFRIATGPRRTLGGSSYPVHFFFGGMNRPGPGYLNNLKKPIFLLSKFFTHAMEAICC